MKSKVRLNVCGTDYFITSEDDESYIRAVGNEVDEKMNELISSNQRVSTTMAAVLCALSYADECKKATTAADGLRVQIKDYVEETSRARLEADEARREIERLRRELQGLRARMADLNNRT
ncbi:MAG: cell division protein ZapA [Oscillospiraceae bacterium]|jgi:cell division protein ZapA (FtsZ GTPase activity inhibitor)|nr:cell division protein ZapA [Oscillospiraceae bacterium]